jgi:hypothetical protein
VQTNEHASDEVAGELLKEPAAALPAVQASKHTPGELFVEVRTE